MRSRRLATLTLAGLVLSGACRRSPDSTVTLPADAGTGAPRRDEPPVAIDAETPVRYPLALYQQRISGTVLLRLFVDESGRVAPDSTRVQESSGYPALDSAALAAAPKLSFAPALRNGTPVATLFIQPIHFRHPDRGGTTP
jgi:TonB family protein